MTKDEDQIIKATLSAFGPDEGVTFAQDTWAKLHQAISAVILSDALAESRREVARLKAVQEPVAVMELYASGWDLIESVDLDWLQTLPFGTKLYTTPPAQPAPMQDVDWKDMYEKEKRRSEMWVAKYEKDIGPLEYAVPVAAPVQECLAHGECFGGKCIYTTPQRVVFPTMLRKMWSGGEVQAWLDETVNKEKNT
jgi:hypothetical protein